MSSEIQENLKELITHAIKANKIAINAIERHEYKAVLQNARLTLECICKGICLMNQENYDQSLHRQIQALDRSSYIGNKADDFYRLKNLGNNGAHKSNHENPVTRDDSKEARQLLNQLINFFYLEILETSVPKELNVNMQTAPIKELQAGYKKLYTEDALNDVPLADIYVLPRATFWKHSVTTSNYTENFEAIPSCINLHQFIKHFNTNELDTHYEKIRYPSSQALILLGAPGQGKTSFCKRVLYDFIHETEVSKSNIYYIKLREIDDSEFLEKPFPYLIKNKNFPETTAKDLEKALIILDGLDELYLHNGGHLSEVDAFINTLLKQLKNPHYKKTKLILTSRFGYLSLDKLEYEKNVTIASIDTFDEAQQIEWVEKYCATTTDREAIQLTADKVREIHRKVPFQKQPLAHFQELFEQPVLLHLFVLSGLEVNIKTKRTEIYQQLFKKLGKRVWEEEPSEALKRINGNQLKNISKAIAFEMYKNNKTFLDKTALDEIQEVQDFYEQIGTIASEQKKELYRYLFIAFYWQDKNEVLEFLHKSLQEYLIAERIWDEFQKIATTPCTSSSDALAIIWSFAAHQMIPTEIQENLVEIIENDTADYNTLLGKMRAYFPNLLKKQFMQECMPVEPIKGSVHTFYLYLLVLNTVHSKVYSNTTAEEPTYLNLDKSNWGFSDLFNIAQLYYRGRQWNLSCCFIKDYMQFTYDLFFSKFETTKLNHISFHDIKFHETSFNQSILEQVRMNKTYLEYCTFEKTQINQLDATAIEFHRNTCIHISIKRTQFRPKSVFSCNLFTSAKIIDTNFRAVHIDFTSFEAGIFYEKGIYSWGQYYQLTSSFDECTFRGCSFEKANLTCVSFRKAKINGNSFERADITQANFSEALFKHGYFPKNFSSITKKETYPEDISVDNILQFASFNNAFGKRASFYKATLKGVHFENANLDHVNFSYATIESYYDEYNLFNSSIKLETSVNFEQATLIQANFQNAKLKGVNFNHANLSRANFSSASIENHIHEFYDLETSEDKEQVIYSSFKYTNLEAVNFRGAVLINIDFQEANLTKSNLANLDLSGCNFCNANLRQVNLSCSILNGVNFEGADLTDVEWINEFSQALRAVEYGEAKIQRISDESLKITSVQITPIDPDKTWVDLIFKQIFEQIKTVKSFYNTKGIPSGWKEALKQQGYAHLFEAPQV